MFNFFYILMFRLPPFYRQSCTQVGRIFRREEIFNVATFPPKFNVINDQSYPPLSIWPFDIFPDFILSLAGPSFRRLHRASISKLIRFYGVWILVSLFERGYIEYSVNWLSLSSLFYCSILYQSASRVLIFFKLID